MSNPYPLFSLNFLKAYWITMRPYLLFVSGVTGLAGLALAGTTPPAKGIVIFIIFFFSYGFGQALTDCFQTDTDALSSPYRPLIQGLITKLQVLGVSLAGLLSSGVILFFCHPYTLLLSLLAVLGLATYTTFKRRWWAGPFYNAWIVALIPVIAALAGGALPLAAFREPPARWILFSVFFGYANFVLMGYYKDISADRATGYRTLPVVWGWQPAAGVSDLFALLTFCFSGLLLYEKGLASWQTWLSLCFWLAGVASTALAQGQIHRLREEALTYRPIANVVRGYVLIHLGLSSALNARLLLWGLIFYGWFEWTLRARPEPKQV